MFDAGGDFICSCGHCFEVRGGARFALRPGARLAAGCFRQSSQISSDYGLIVVNIRLPRILLGVTVGASLSVAGTRFQPLLLNPLGGPYVFCVSIGAPLGAILAPILEPHLSIFPLFAALLTPLGAFHGAPPTI